MKFGPGFGFLRARPDRQRSRVLALALWAMSSWMPAHGQADEPVAGSPPPQAVEHYNRGRAHYQAGRYKEALVELEKALALDPHSPNLMYNVARVYELLGDMDHAISAYERYQQMLPPHEREERERVAATLQRLRGAREEAPVTPPSATPPKMEHGVADAVFWTTLGTGAAAFAASAVTGTFALQESKKAQNFVLGKDGNVVDRNHVVHRADRLALSTDVLILGGATFVITSVLLYMLREKPVEAEDDGLRIGFGAMQQGAMVTLGGAL